MTSVGFTGEQEDPSGLLYLRARYYAPSQGRFFQLDIWYGNLKSPITQNPYLYGLDNPILYTDPSGYCVGILGGADTLLCAIAGVMTVGAAIGVATGTASYFMARGGLCGCELEEWAKSLDAQEFAVYLARAMAFSGVAAGAALIPGVAPVLGGIGAAVSINDIKINGPNVCNVIGLAASIAGGFAGSQTSFSNPSGPNALALSTNAGNFSPAFAQATSTIAISEEVGALTGPSILMFASQDNDNDSDQIEIDERHSDHMFGNRGGHIEDTPANRQLLEETANNPQNYLGSDTHGNDWYAEILPDGSQVWITVRDNMITNGGVNEVPKTYNSETGLSAPSRK